MVTPISGQLLIISLSMYDTSEITGDLQY